MALKIKYLLSSGASVLTIGAGGIAAQATVTKTQGFDVRVYGDPDGMLSNQYVITDMDGATPTPLPTIVVGVTATDITNVAFPLRSGPF